MDHHNTPSIHMNHEFIFRKAIKKDIEKCYKLESKSYPIDEMASRKTLLYRQNVANDYFYILTIKNEESSETLIIIGFICGTRCNTFEHETMSNHESDGSYLAIHSVVIDSNYRRQKYASYMIKQYIDAIAKQQQKIHDHNSNIKNNNPTMNPIQTIILLSKSYLLGFYVQNGFHVMYVLGFVLYTFFLLISFSFSFLFSL